MVTQLWRHSLSVMVWNAYHAPEFIMLHTIANFNQRTSGPVNAHPTPGSGIYFNAFTHVYSPRAGADNPLGTNVDVNRKPLLFCPCVASFKTISLKYDFKHILNDFIHVYNPRAGTDNPLGTKFWCQQKFLITLLMCCQLKKIALKSVFFTVFFNVFISHVYSPKQGQTTHWGQKFYDNRKAFPLCPHIASFKMISLKSDFIHIFNNFIHVYSPGTKAGNLLGINFRCQQKALINSTIWCKFQTNLFEFWFYTQFVMFSTCI